MPSDCISYTESGYFSPIVCDYLSQKPELQPFYNRFPNLENFAAQIEEKRANYKSDRTILVSRLKDQYQTTDATLRTQENIRLLGHDNTYTVTTGHQLNLFTGPLYFLYKIVSAINLCNTLKNHYPDCHFVPVYWMATEDHDFAEINHFNFKGRKFSWPRESKGPVGRLDNSGLDDFLKVFSSELGVSENADRLRKLFENYLNAESLAQATRAIVNELFGRFGLVILDGDDRELKRQFIHYVKEELVRQAAFKTVSETIDKLDYDIQVNPREINLFYIGNGTRERIVERDGSFSVNNTSIAFSQSEIIAEVENHPENFSPNVILRPLYQEVILPNLCYIGGGGELAYWFELKPFFESQDVTFPILLLRNSAVLATEKQAKKADKLRLSWGELFLRRQSLANHKVAAFSVFDLDFTGMKETLRRQFDQLSLIAKQTDGSFEGAVRAQESKQIKGLENLEKRLLKAEKRNHADELARIAALQESLFPNGSLQERFSNFSEFYLEYGDGLIDRLIAELQPLSQEFKVIVL